MPKYHQLIVRISGEKKQRFQEFCKAHNMSMTDHLHRIIDASMDPECATEKREREINAWLGALKKADVLISDLRKDYEERKQRYLDLKAHAEAMSIFVHQEEVKKANNGKFAPFVHGVKT